MLAVLKSIKSERLSITDRRPQLTNLGAIALQQHYEKSSVKIKLVYNAFSILILLITT